MTFFSLSRYAVADSAMPACTPTVICTGLGAFTVAVALVKWPTVMAKSGAVGADQVPFPSGTPVASTSYPGGTVTWAVKSAAGVIAVSPWARVGPSVAQPTPGSHARIGKNEPSRTLSPTRAIRSRLAPGSVSSHGRLMSTGSLAATACGTTRVVASGCWAAAGWPLIVTGPGCSFEPALETSGALPHSRKTSRSVGRSGVKWTATVPETVLSSGRTSTFRSYTGLSAL